jgi:hypothetical protein
MLTGSTVEQWDTMIYLKDSSSAQEYDQAIFRLQNQYIKIYQDKNGNEIKHNMKPQTLLVDFDPQRMFRMQELKSQIYNANVDKLGNDELESRIAKELDISPIVYFNKDKIERVEASYILKVVSEYSKNRGVAEETNDIPVDLDLMANKTIWDAISKENELGSKNGFTIKPTEGDGEDIDYPDDSEDDEKESSNDGPSNDKQNEPDEDDSHKKAIKQFRMYYARILFYAFLTKTEVHSLNQVIESFNDEENSRICRNLGLSKVVLKELCRRMNCFMLSKLDYKIQNLNKLSRDDSVDPLQRAEIAISKFGRISDSEIVTPTKIANQMVAELPSKVFEVGGKPILDIAAKEGELAAALCNRFEKLKVEKKAYKNQIYSIVTSKVAYEFTRKVYEILGLNTDNISELFTSYDILDVKTEDGKCIDCSRVKSLLSQKKKFNKITLKDNVSKKDAEMKFGAVVGNPPYHKENAENGRKPPIYNHFMDLSYVFAPVSVLITPARFLFGAGQTPSEWNERILNDIHFKIGMYEPDSAKVFPNAIKDIKGGLLISIHDINSSFDSIGVFSPYNELNSILRKVRGKTGFIPLENIVSSQGVFKFTKKCLVEHPEIEKVAGKGTKEKIVSKVVELLPKVFTEQSQNASSILLLAKGKNARIMRYIARKNIQENDYIDTYNVLVPESNGKGAFDEFSSPVISKPGEGFSDTFISIGTFITQNEAENALKYIMTKFARTMLGIKKATQHNPKSTWAYVPLLDFSSKSDIVWSKSVTKIDEVARKKYKLDINEIDAQLYAKYNLSKEEITFIETHVKEMK